MIVKTEQIEVLKPYIENIEELVESDDVQAVLDAIDDVISEDFSVEEVSSGEVSTEEVSAEQTVVEKINENDLLSSDENHFTA